MDDIFEKSAEVLGDTFENVENVFLRDKLKKKMLQLGASYDRGFGASSSARRKVDSVIAELESLNEEKDASRFISGLSNSPVDNNSTEASSSPLMGNWRMIWTSAPDVLILGANPFVSVGAIYQIFDPPIVTNVIDLLPRIQNLLPPSSGMGSLLRAKVETRASPRSDNPMRVGLVFERVSLNPVELMGQDVSTTLPPFGFDLPKFEAAEDLGYFDVTFLDDEMVIIRQNAPGGLFVLAKVDDIDP